MLEQSWKTIYSRTTIKSVPLLQPEHGFCQQNGPEHGQLQDWYPDEKWWLSPFVWMVDVVLQGVWVLYRVNKDEGNESLPFLVFRRHLVNDVFLKYSKDGRLSSSLVGIRNIPSDICYKWDKTLPGAIWTQAYSEPLQAFKMECFCIIS